MGKYPRKLFWHVLSFVKQEIGEYTRGRLQNNSVYMPLVPQGLVFVTVGGDYLFPAASVY